MALKLDNSLLQDLGLGALPDSEKQLLLRQIYERLEMNVGMRLADQMSNEQLDAFEKFVDANDDKGAFQWLESNFPNYKDVVNEEFEKLKAEIRSVAPQILASAQQQAGSGQGQGGQQGQQSQQGQTPQMSGGNANASAWQQPAGPAGPMAPGGQSAQPAPQGGFNGAQAPQFQPDIQGSHPFQPQPAPQQPTPQSPYGPQPQFAGADPYGSQPGQPVGQQQAGPAMGQSQQFQPQPQSQAGQFGMPPQPGAGAMPANGHLQPQYGAPGPNSQQFGGYGQPGQPGNVPLPGQPPAGPPTNS